MGVQPSCSSRDHRLDTRARRCVRGRTERSRLIASLGLNPGDIGHVEELDHLHALCPLFRRATNDCYTPAQFPCDRPSRIARGSTEPSYTGSVIVKGRTRRTGLTPCSALAVKTVEFPKLFEQCGVDPCAGSEQSRTAPSPPEKVPSACSAVRAAPQPRRRVMSPSATR